MLYFWIIMTLFWAFILYKPEIIAYIIWILFIVIWFNIILIKLILNKKYKNWKSYVSFWKYKIYKE